MTRFVAALLVAVGGAVKAEVNPCTPGTAGLAPFQERAELRAAFLERGRRQRKEDDALLADLGDALREQRGPSCA